MSRAITKSIMTVLGVTALLLSPSGPALTAPSEKNHARPIEKILEHLDILKDTVENLRGAIGPCEVPPVWGKKYVGADRFVAVLDGAGYCDQETGLVWDRSPDITGGGSNNGRRVWEEAISHCANREVDGRKGFHLPMREQLASLVDTMGTSGVTLPDDHPFLNVQLNAYWSTTTIAHFPLSAWVVDFSDGEVRDNHKDGFLFAWCVRGGQSYDGQDVNEVIGEIAVTHP